MVVGEVYDLTAATRTFVPITMAALMALFLGSYNNSGKDTHIKQLLNSGLDYGPALIEHALLLSNFNANMTVREYLLCCALRGIDISHNTNENR